jgi:HPt (histidine-containing phosphotransfer) domain-containing protein
MTIQECYNQIDGDYAGVKCRLIDDERILRFLIKFKTTSDYTRLMDALRKEDYETAFCMAHNLKGIGLNLGFTSLYKESNVLCEALRGGKPSADISEMISAVEEEYNKVMDAISSLLI